MELTKIERLLLSNQLLILEKLYPDDADSYAAHRKAIENGYVIAYSDYTHHLYDEMPREDSIEVLDILTMFTAIERAVAKTSDQELKKHSYARFIGFDGNNEGTQLGYFRYLQEVQEKFTWFKGEGAWDSYNSHMPVLDTYRRMLAEWSTLPLEEKHTLSDANLKRLLGATQIRR